MDELHEFLNTHKVPGKMLFAKVWGSRSHNTHKEDSDWDFSGLYIAPTRDVLGMSEMQETYQNEDNAPKPDFAFHEGRKFATLLLKGNPGILEMLFTERMCIETPEWCALKERRNSFLSKESVQQYVGYAEGQLKRLKAGSCLHTKGCGYNEKWAYHLMRLLIDAQRIVEGGEPLVWKEDGPERDFLMSIRRELVSRDEVVSEADKRIKFIYGILDSEDCKLPAVGDKEFLQNWLVDVRLKNL
jgi:predicted nucleotidyltransferase